MTSPGRFRGLIAAAAVIAGLLIPVALAAPASAAASCTGVSTITHGGLSFEMPTIGNETKNVNCVLGFGNISQAVAILQDHLNGCYWSGSNVQGHLSAFSTKLEVDGNFRSLTKAALLAAQKTVPNIAHDGVYGPETRRNINFFADDGRLGHCAKFAA